MAHCIAPKEASFEMVKKASRADFCWQVSPIELKNSVNMSTEELERTGSREAQAYIVCSIAAAALIYVALTSWVPVLYRWVATEYERRSVLKSINEDKAQIDSTMESLRGYKSGKQKEVAAPPVISKPNFTLRIPTGQATPNSSQFHDTNTNETHVEILASSTPSVAARTTSRATYKFQPKTGGSGQQTDSPSRPARSLSTFAPGSIESSVHQVVSSLQRQSSSTSTSTAGTVNRQALAADRAVRQQQDAELRASEERDQRRQQEEAKKAEHAARVEECRSFLASRVSAEPAAGEEDVVTLQLRFRHSNSIVDTQANRIRRRFCVRTSTVEDLLLFVESRELRPLLSGEYELTVDFPTRVMSHKTDPPGQEAPRTLHQAGISTDCVVWVTFSAD